MTAPAGAAGIASLDELAALARDHSALPLDELCRTLADRYPSDGHDDLAILALRLPPGG